MSDDIIPTYWIYGEPSRPLDLGFVHVERVRAREDIHKGRVAPHQHDHMGQITIWTHGLGRYFIEDQSWTFEAPAVAYLPAGLVHGFNIAPGSDAVVISVATEHFARIGRNTILPLDQPQFIASSMEAAWQTDHFERLALAGNDIWQEHELRLPGSDKAIDALLALICTLIARLGTPAVPLKHLPRDTAIARAFQNALEMRFRDAWYVDEYVEAIGTTTATLDRAVRKVLGRSVKTAILERRLLEAKRLLLFTARPVEDIAMELGFGDAAYFCRFFKRYAGVAPAHWRAAQTS